MKTEGKNNKIGYIYFIVYLEKKYIIFRPPLFQATYYYRQGVFSVCVWHILVVTWKEDSQQFTILLVLKIT